MIWLFNAKFFEGILIFRKPIRFSKAFCAKAKPYRFDKQRQIFHTNLHSLFSKFINDLKETLLLRAIPGNKDDVEEIPVAENDFFFAYNYRML